MKQPYFYVTSIMVYSMFAMHIASATITLLSPDQLVQQAKNPCIVKDIKAPKIIANYLPLKRDENNQYIDDMVRIDKKDTQELEFEASKFIANESPLKIDQNNHYDADTVKIGEKDIQDRKFKESSIIANNSPLKTDENNQVRIAKKNTGDSITVDFIQRNKSKTLRKRSVKSAKHKSDRDLILEVVKPLLEQEKMRRRFDLVDPPNSRYVKNEQLLWNKLRIKAAEELLMHPKPRLQIPTERIFDSFKSDLEALASTTAEPGLFEELKLKVEKQHYLDQYERNKGFISTLRP